MGRIIVIYCLLFLTSQSPVIGQQDTTLQVVLQKKIPGNCRNFYADNLGNVYLINTDNRIKKLNAAGDSLTVYNDLRRYGDLYSMDVSNPFKEILFYKDFLTLVIVDKYLNTLNTLNLRNCGILQAKAVSLSYDNNYWIFDEWSNTLKKMDDYGKILLESPDFRLAFPKAFNPEKIIDADGVLYLYDENVGWKIFDYYGHFKKNLPFPGWKDVQAFNGMVYGWVNGKVVQSAITLPDAKKYDLPIEKKGILKTSFVAKKFYVLYPDGLFVFTFQ